MVLCVLLFSKPLLPSLFLIVSLEARNLVEQEEAKYRVRTGLGKPGKSWNFVVAFSRTGKSWKKATGPGKFWKSV